jgi:Holliday junction resolvasome RuvABC DNA-binding subunit
LELKGKIIKLNGQALDGFDSVVSGSDEIDALIALGYSLPEAREALSLIPSNIIGSGARVKEALKNMKK